jgi:hypothetical protein
MPALPLQKSPSMAPPKNKFFDFLNRFFPPQHTVQDFSPSFPLSPSETLSLGLSLSQLLFYLVYITYLQVVRTTDNETCIYIDEKIYFILFFLSNEYFFFKRTF